MDLPPTAMPWGRWLQDEIQSTESRFNSEEQNQSGSAALFRASRDVLANQIARLDARRVTRLYFGNLLIGVPGTNTGMITQTWDIPVSLPNLNRTNPIATIILTTINNSALLSPIYGSSVAWIGPTKILMNGETVRSLVFPRENIYPPIDPGVDSTFGEVGVRPGNNVVSVQFSAFNGNSSITYGLGEVTVFVVWNESLT